MQTIKRIYGAYKKLLGELFPAAPFMILLTVLLSLAHGITTPLSVYVNAQIFNDGVAVAQGQMSLGEYIPYLIFFALLMIAPAIINDIFIYGYVEPRSQLILRTVLKGRMLEKIKRMKYMHFENEASIEIIDKAYNRTENAARILFPMYLSGFLSAVAGSVGLLYLLGSIRWWLLATVLIPAVLETAFAAKNNYNIYTELEKYWKKEHSYTLLGKFLKTKEYLKENKLNHASDYLISTYRTRLNARNKEYERYYLKHLKHTFAQNNVTKLAIILNVILLLFLFIKNEITVGVFISTSLAMFTQVFSTLTMVTHIFRWSGFQINTFDYYDKYFDLSEDEQTNDCEIPSTVRIEFHDVWFRYPNTDKDILRGLSFTVEAGEKVSIVGENGEGKSTMVKLLLGLFVPTRGEIRINGRSLFDYSEKSRSRIFGTVFQDFVRYSISAKENVEIGCLDNATDENFQCAIQKSKADRFLSKLPSGSDTLLGRDFEGGVDLSGGQWQRIAISRAFMGDKPVLVFDEPTSQLDPIAESNLYHEFSQMADGKTAITITHRLASTMITDRILVLSKGRIAESGNHEELMKLQGIYAQMFESQKQWYRNAEES